VAVLQVPYYFTFAFNNYEFVFQGDSRLQVDNWQAQLYNVTNMPILQDSYWVDAWERFGGGEGDIFIYDSDGMTAYT
jgi:hypothetical protein